MKINYKKLTIIVTVLLIIFCIYYTFPRRFEKSYAGIEYRLGNEKYQEEVHIKISGWYTRKIFSSDYFQGDMIIGDVNLSKVKIFTQKDRELLLGVSEDGTEAISYGNIYIHNKFEEITISVLEDGDKPGSKHWNAKDGLMIAAPSDDREDALKLSNKLIKNFYGQKVTLK